MVGIGTVLADDPQLTCRIRGGRNPLRIILDPRLRIPLKARVLNEPGKTIVVAGENASRAQAEGYGKSAGAEIWRFPVSRKRDFRSQLVLKSIADGKWVSVLIEGGGRDRRPRRAAEKGCRQRSHSVMLRKSSGGDGLPAVAGLGVKDRNTGLAVRDCECRNDRPRIFAYRIPLKC
jgi:diaminohydroxyphosphoribosylaminopyrimidine deaminase/5-amino-6-(5-phosphoribosylamino)uracil reductase